MAPPGCVPAVSGLERVEVCRALPRCAKKLRRGRGSPHPGQTHTGWREHPQRHDDARRGPLWAGGSACSTPGKSVPERSAGPSRTVTDWAEPNGAGIRCRQIGELVRGAALGDGRPTRPQRRRAPSARRPGGVDAQQLVLGDDAGPPGRPPDGSSLGPETVRPWMKGSGVTASRDRATSLIVAGRSSDGVLVGVMERLCGRSATGR